MRKTYITKMRKEEKTREKRLYIQQLLAVALLGLIAGVVLTKSIFDAGHRIINPGPSSEVKTTKVMADEPVRYCNDAISHIRCAGEDAGLPNVDIRKLIRIAKCESGYKADAKNGTSSATGIFQFLWGTWDANKCSGEKWDFKDNIDCAIKVYKLQGDIPWRSSERCWDK